jgi:primase-polymerase (primpol)-like protein
VTAQPPEGSLADETSRVGLDFDAMERVSLDDETLLEKAHDAENGAKFGRLWRGDTSGYDSHSEADMALCCLLAFWTGRDPRRIDELFRRSGLLRKKWDETHYADGSTYGEKTVARACRQTSETY